MFRRMSVKPRVGAAPGTEEGTAAATSEPSPSNTANMAGGKASSSAPSAAMGPQHSSSSGGGVVNSTAVGMPNPAGGTTASLLVTPIDGEAQERREVCIMDPLANRPHGYCSNAITTSKYSLVPLSRHFLLWKNLFEQFQRLANVYFLFISILQVIPGLSPTGRWTTLIPLVLVLFVSLVKDSWEDWKRRVADRAMNLRATYVFRSGEWTQVAWRDVAVGDVVCVAKGEPFPADLVALWSTQAEGLLYIETASLDGETNLKLRKAPTAIYTHFRKQPLDGPHRVPNPSAFSGRVVCELPNNRLYQFDGYVERMDGGKLQPRVPLSADHLLLRGAELRNTNFVLGVVAFTGDDTKLMRNATAKHSKQSNVDHVTNRQIMLVFVCQIALSIICAVGYRVAAGISANDSYLSSEVLNPNSEAALAFLTFMILLNSLIPISLYVMLEVVKLVQASLINNDLLMYSVSRDTPAQARSSRLNEELGQVNYIFCDKTGTLTCNQMEFKRFTCPRLEEGMQVMASYGGDSAAMPESTSGSFGTQGSPTSPPASPRPAQSPGTANAVEFHDVRISKGAWRTQPNREEIRFLLQTMAVCNTVIPEREELTGRVVYQASSPDEGCLVRAARKQGVELVERTESQLRIREFGQDSTWEILNVIEFTSTRKRMSVIVRDPMGRLLLLCKGADTVIMDRVRRDANTAMTDHTLETLARFATEGLRTLVFAKVDLSQEFYKRWRRRYDAASTSIHERQDKVDAVAEEIERDWDLIGTTAIEDRLQDRVPQSIQVLSKAGIKLWVLTGDKQETAINIGYSCHLLRPEMGLFTFEHCNRKNLTHALEKYLTDVEAAAIESGQDIGLVIQGSMLEGILPEKDDLSANEHECDLFVSLATRCKAVICCRVSPLQKAQIVQAVRDRVGGVTLAIGDGANDVSMIQTAAVGVGISGLEGLQAARAADYSIAQFRFLVRLLLVHGRWSYRRIAKLVVFAFYKNMSLYLTQFWFCFHNLFTGQSLYDSWALAMYNLAFTAFPIMALAIFDRDVEAKRVCNVNQFPELYKFGIENRFFNTYEFWTYTITAVVHSLMLFYLPLLSMSTLVDPNGRDLGLTGHGITAYTCVLFVVTLKCALETHTWTVFNFAVSIASIMLWFIFLLLYTSMYSWFDISDFAQWYGGDVAVLSHPQFWLTVMVVTLTTILRDFVVAYWNKNYNPNLADCIQAFESTGRDFDRNDIRRAVPWLFPRHEVKTFKPTLFEGVGHHRFTAADALTPQRSLRSGGGALGSPGLSASRDGPAASMPGLSPTSSGGGSGAFGQASSAGSASFLVRPDERSPGRRKIRITDILDEEI